jgi:hypothetical protein
LKPKGCRRSLWFSAGLFAFRRQTSKVLRSLTAGIMAVLMPAFLLSGLSPLRAEVLTIGNVRIHAPAEVENYCRRSGAETYLCFPGSRDWKLSDASPVQGYPMDLEAVAEAVCGVGYPLDGIDIDILILPVARLDLPNSSAEGRVVFLSPGRVPYPRDHVHYTVVHEIGHVLHHTLMPASRGDLWQAYADIRGLPSAEVDPGASHASRISEIFAEDFRVLFGGSRARCGGEVENHDLASPEAVAGLRDFMLSLPGEWKGCVALSASPNPFESSIVLRAFSLDEPVNFDALDIYDVRGRVIRSFTPGRGSDEIVWDGRDQGGRPVAPGMYMLSLRAGTGRHFYKVLKVSP